MSIKRIQGAPNLFYMPKAASTAFVNQGLVYANGSGYLIPADATSGDHFGIILRSVVAADADYASASMVPVDVISPGDVCEMDVATGTLTVAMVGNAYDLHANGDSLDVTATSKKVVTVIGFVSATKALVRVNSMAAHFRVATT